MIVYTCVTKDNVEQAVLWAASLSHNLKKGTGGIKTYLFYTDDVRVSRFFDFHVNAVQVSGEFNSPEELFVKATDLLTTRLPNETALYVTADALFQNNLEELRKCPLDNRLWLAARNEYVYFDSKRNSKFYRIFDEDYERKFKLGYGSYFNADVLMFKVAELRKRFVTKGYKTLMDWVDTKTEEWNTDVTGAMNLLVNGEEYINLLDRFNAFAEDVLDLDFGEMVTRRREVATATIVNFKGDNKPWLPAPNETELVTSTGCQYPFHHYKEACDMFCAYISRDFRVKVNENHERYNLLPTWEAKILDPSNDLKRRLDDFKERMKQSRSEIVY